MSIERQTELASLIIARDRLNVRIGELLLALADESRPSAPETKPTGKPGRPIGSTGRRPAEGRVVAALLRKQPQTVRELTETSGVCGESIKAIVRRMQQEGRLVVRGSSPGSSNGGRRALTFGLASACDEATP